jgi:hypothetical protein
MVNPLGCTLRTVVVPDGFQEQYVGTGGSSEQGAQSFIIATGRS